MLKLHAPLTRARNNVAPPAPKRKEKTQPTVVAPGDEPDVYEVEALVGKRTKKGRIQYEVKWQATMSPDLSARDAGAKRSREHKWEVGEAQSGRAARSEVRTKVVEVEASGTGCARPRRLKAPLSLRARGLLRPDDAREHQRARSRTRRRRPARAASHRASQSRDAAHDGTGCAGLACSVRDPRAVEVCWRAFVRTRGL